MISREHTFWIDGNKYEDLARQYEQNIELTHPQQAKGECSHICGRCPWAATTVTYKQYNGPAV